MKEIGIRINVLLETLLGKACLMEGTFGDATPFTSNSVNIAEEICDRLEKTGYNKYGWETLYSGFTGEPIEAKIYTGCNGRSNAKTLLVCKYFIGNTFKLREHLVMSLILTYFRNKVGVLVNY